MDQGSKDGFGHGNSFGSVGRWIRTISPDDLLIYLRKVNISWQQCSLVLIRADVFHFFMPKDTRPNSNHFIHASHVQKILGLLQLKVNDSFVHQRSGLTKRRERISSSSFNLGRGL